MMAMQIISAINLSRVAKGWIFSIFCRIFCPLEDKSHWTSMFDGVSTTRCTQKANELFNYLIDKKRLNVEKKRSVTVGQIKHFEISKNILLFIESLIFHVCNPLSTNQSLCWYKNLFWISRISKYQSLIVRSI